MKRGKITQTGSESSVEVEYDLWVRGLDDAGGSIRIGDDPTPGVQFMGNPASAIPGGLIYQLETASGVPVSIFFRSSDGRFTCQIADEARAAIKAGG